MNIFLVLLSVLLMAGYYMIYSPAQRIPEHETEYAIKMADLHSIAECVVTAQNAAMYGEEIDDECLDVFDVKSQYVCMNKKYSVVPCDFNAGNTPIYNYIITTSYKLPEEEYNSMLEILEKYYPDAGNFGVFENKELISVGSIGKTTIPEKIVKGANLKDGQLVYIMQYKIPDENMGYNIFDDTDIVCPAGTNKTYRFGRWQCVAYNYKISCTGDTIWDSDLMTCVNDESRKPLCATNQTAVMVDNVWECIDPVGDKNCPKGFIARLNYTTLEWECTEDPNYKKDVKKCTNLPSVRKLKDGISLGSTLRVRTIYCTDCEKAVVDEETCDTYCVPDPEKLLDKQCYSGDIEECSGTNRAIYFGFTPKSYTGTIQELKNKKVIFDNMHSQNRRFNCLDCGESDIDTEKSLSPYTAVCK